jgi:hypothetical protein
MADWLVAPARFPIEKRARKMVDRPGVSAMFRNEKRRDK